MESRIRYSRGIAEKMGITQYVKTKFERRNTESKCPY
jgi:hypothetical protein